MEYWGNHYSERRGSVGRVKISLNPGRYGRDPRRTRADVMGPHPWRERRTPCWCNQTSGKEIRDETVCPSAPAINVMGRGYGVPWAVSSISQSTTSLSASSRSAPAVSAAP